MKVVARAGNDNIASVFLAEPRPGKFVEFVESVQPPVPKKDKWVLIVSTLFGCPVGCGFCDAGGWYDGRLTKEEIFSQVDYLICRDFPGRKVPVGKFKIQFARMGEPALNPAVLEVLEEFPRRYDAPGFMPSISSVAPRGSESFFEELLRIKREHYGGGRFQLQFSIHSSDDAARDRLIPVKKWDFGRIADYGARFFAPGDRKVTLNFALAEDVPLCADTLAKFFPTDRFLIKITPVNPTLKALENNIGNAVISESRAHELPAVRSLKRKGYDVLISIGELEENKIGSNCGQYVKRFLDGRSESLEEAYRYGMETILLETSYLDSAVDTGFIPGPAKKP